MTYEAAYPGVRLLPSSRNWWAWLKGSPAECIHLDRESQWMATLLPDTLYLRGKKTLQRDPSRPEISLCRECLTGTVGGELAEYRGRVVAFEPDPEAFTQYFFIAAPDFQAAGMAPEVATAIEGRLGDDRRTCSCCGQQGSWLWFSRTDVASLDEVERIGSAMGESLCPSHGARKLCDAFKEIPEANLFYMNLPYGKAGAYLWI
jgi:hypothetical protein